MANCPSGAGQFAEVVMKSKEAVRQFNDDDTSTTVLLLQYSVLKDGIRFKKGCRVKGVTEKA